MITRDEVANPLQIRPKLSERTANFILRALRRNSALPWCRRMLSRFELPPTVQHHAHHRVWERGGCDMNIWSEKREKLNYMHANPVKRGLMSQPGDWPWSSWRFYCLEDSSIWRWIERPDNTTRVATT